MPDPYKRPYLDSSVFIAAIKGSPPEPAGRAQEAKKILRAAENGEFRIVASAFLKAEVVGKSRIDPPLTVDQIKTIDGYLQRSHFDWYDLDIPTAEKARDLARAHGLRPPDSVHLATAIRGGADQLLTWDDKFVKRAGVYEGVQVVEAYFTGQAQIEDQ